MEICIVTPYAAPEKGAAIVRVNSFCAYFESMGHKVTILVPERQGHKSFGNIIRYNGVLPLAGHILSKNFDIVIGTSPPITHAFFAMLASKLKGVPFCADSKDIFTHTASKLGLINKNSIKFAMFSFMENAFHKYSDKIFTLDEQIAQWIRKKYSLKEGKVMVAANGVDTGIVMFDAAGRKEIRKMLKINPKTKVVVYCGGLGDEQYLKFLEVASSSVKKHSAKIIFIIASDNSPSAQSHLAQIQNAVEKLGLNENFILLKNIEHGQIYKYLSAADIGVDFWSHLELFAVTVKIMEYMACGLPVVVKSPKNNKSYEEFFRKHDAGFCSPDWEEFGKMFEYALSDFSEFRKKGLESTNIIKNNYTRNATNKRVLEVLERLVKNE